MPARSRGDAAANSTLQPIRRFGFNSAILFFDILIRPDALSQTVAFESGEGPRLDPDRRRRRLGNAPGGAGWEKLGPVFETLDRLKTALPAEVVRVGFCGARWTGRTV
jgi:uroporphyrinogen decarboxylase